MAERNPQYPLAQAFFGTPSQDLPARPPPRTAAVRGGVPSGSTSSTCDVQPLALEQLSKAAEFITASAQHGFAAQMTLPGLNPIRFEVNRGARGIRARFVVSSKEDLRLFESSVDTLAYRLRDRGVEVEDVGVVLSESLA